MIRRSAFTIIELVIAIGIFLTLTGLLLWSTDSITGSWQQLRQHNADLNDEQRLDRTLDTIFSNVVPLKWDDPNGKNRVFFDGQPDTMRLVYQHEPNSHGALRFCALALDGDTLKLHHSNVPAYFFETESVLVDGVKNMECSYFTFNRDGEQVRSSIWDKDRSLPMGIMVNIEFENGRQLSWFRRTPGNSAYERWGEEGDDEAE